MNKTNIEWTDYTWNPVTGCHKVSRGCKNCYAETLTNRFAKTWGVQSFREIKLHPNRLTEPTKNRKKWAGKKVFVCSMSDLFQEGVPFEFIASVFAEIKVTPDTTYQILTKRPQRALEFYNWVQNNIQTVAQSFPVISFIKVGSFFPPQNVWIGTSVENQATANKRIPYLIEIPASVRFLSCEPLLGEIDIKYYLLPSFKEFMEGSKKPRIDWVIAGGESGHGAEPTHPNWVRSLRDQCASANVPFLFKQWGAWLPTEKIDGNVITHLTPGKGLSKKKFIRFDGFPTVVFRKAGKSKAGNLLDGVQHLNFPL